MALHHGDLAPTFTATTLDGQQLTLDTFRGHRLLLSFYRTAVCPLCSLRVWYLTQRATRWQAQGLQILGIFESTAEETEHYCQSITFTFPIIADPQRRLFLLYGAQESLFGLLRGAIIRLPDVWRAKRLHLGGCPNSRLMPLEFLIDEEGRIAMAHYGKDHGDYLPFDTIDHFAAQPLVTQSAGKIR